MWNWSTPRASDPEKAGPNMRGSKGDVPLPAQAMNWSTPTARIHKGGGEAVIRQDGKSRLDMLDWQAEAWSRSSPPDQPTPAGPTSSPERRILNPLFVEWLIGWPIGWTGSGPVETASSHWWQAMRGELLRLGSRRSAQGTRCECCGMIRSTESPVYARKAPPACKPHVNRPNREA